MGKKHLQKVVRLNPFPVIGGSGWSDERKSRPDHEKYEWWRVLWLTGVDYFSTLAYQPGIAFLAAGVLSPLATLLLVIVTLFGALPVYRQVASRSYAGQGSIAMLERMLSGWWSKSCVLILIGFAATDFTITMTLSAADAAQHIIENELLNSLFGMGQIGLTLSLLGALGAVFLIGFREAIRIAIFIAVPYIVLNIIVLVAGIIELANHPEKIANWNAGMAAHGDFVGILIVCSLVFPKLALGMSGFETAVSTMPLIETGELSGSAEIQDRVRKTRKLLFVAALLMSMLLLASSVVTTVLIAPAEFVSGGKAYGRAISFLAHDLFGMGFGTVYDVVTVAILWFAGASALTGLLQIIPRYLPKFGMAPAWLANTRPLVLVIVFFNFLITLIFKADVEAQSGAYATGVLVLILSAAVAVALSLWREADRIRSYYYWGVTFVFAYTLGENIRLRIDGLIVAAVFVFVIITLSMVSRAMRATEIRIGELKFESDASARKWTQIEGKDVHLVTIRKDTLAMRKQKAEEIRKYYAIEGIIAFLHIELTDDRSEFNADLQAVITKEDNNYLIEVKGANAIANTIAFVSESLRPKSIFLSLTRKNPLGQALRFVLWGEGETGLMVYRILLRHWERVNRGKNRPLIFIVSE